MLGSKRLTGLFRRGEAARLRRLAAEPVRHLNDRHSRALAAERQLCAMFGHGDTTPAPVNDASQRRSGIIRPVAVIAAVILLLAVMAGATVSLFAVRQGQEMPFQGPVDEAMRLLVVAALTA